MGNKFVSERNLKFLLYEVGQVEQLCQLPFFADHDRESFDMMLGTALRISDQLLFPAFRDLDQNPPELVEGQVRMERNFALDKKEVADGFVLTCQAHPTTERVVLSFDER